MLYHYYQKFWSCLKLWYQSKQITRITIKNASNYFPWLIFRHKIFLSVLSFWTNNTWLYLCANPLRWREAVRSRAHARLWMSELAIRTIYFEVGKAASVLTGRRLIQVGNTWSNKPRLSLLLSLRNYVTTKQFQYGFKSSWNRLNRRRNGREFSV